MSYNFSYLYCIASDRNIVVFWYWFSGVILTFDLNGSIILDVSERYEFEFNGAIGVTCIIFNLGSIILPDAE